MSENNNTKTVLGPDVKIKGQISLENDAVIMGEVSGQIRVGGMLELTESSRVEGLVIAGGLRLGGQAKADIVAEHGMELLALIVAAGLSCILGYYLLRMVYVSYDFGDRSDGSDEIFIWIPQVPMAVGFAVFAICLVHAIAAGWAKHQADVADNDDDGTVDMAGH